MGATRRAQGKRRHVAALQNVQSPDSRESGNLPVKARWIPAFAGMNGGMPSVELRIEITRVAISRGGLLIGLRRDNRLARNRNED